MTENADDVVDVAGRNTAAAAMVAARAVEPIAAAVQQRAAERARRLEVETRRTQREIEAQRQLMHAELRPVLSPTWWNQDATPATAAAACTCSPGGRHWSVVDSTTRSNPWSQRVGTAKKSTRS